MFDGIQQTLSGFAANELARDWLLGQAVVFGMIACRIGGLMISAGTLLGAVPLRIRAVLVLAMTLVLLPNVTTETPFTSQTDGPVAAEWLLAAGRELIFGMIIGGTIQLLITGIQIAGELIASSTGMQLAQVADPSTGQSVPQLARLFGLLVTAVLFAAGGHRLLIDALLTSFQTAPPMSAAVDQTLLSFVVDHLASGVQAGIRVAAPVVACVLLTNLMVALVSRTIPQLNILAMGMNINLLATLVVIALTVGSAGLVFETELARSITQLSSLGR